MVSAGLSDELHPLINGLRRIRGAYGFYANGSAVHASSFADFTDIVQSLGRQEADARFIFERVLLDTRHPETQDHGEGLFIESLGHWLPEYQNLPYGSLKAVYFALGNLVRQRVCQTIPRAELECRLSGAVPVVMRPEPRVVSLYTSIDQVGRDSASAIHFDWASFFGGQERQYPPPSKWQSHIVGELEATRDWILKNRTSRQIRLQGNRRLSAALCIGSVFSAVAGFVIGLEYRGEVWCTNAYPDSATPPYGLDRDLRNGAGDHLVVALGIAKTIAAEVEGCLRGHGLQGMPVLHLTARQPVLSPAHANAAVQVIKREITEALQSMQAHQIDLFYAGPAHLALFLGHRLNATAPVQCYEWVSPGSYVPTCVLGAGQRER